MDANKPAPALRLLQVISVVALWIALGLAFHLGAVGYLLLGIPLTAFFQLCVGRRPLRALWLRNAAAFRLGAPGWTMAAALAAYPAYCLAANLHARGGIATSLYLLAAMGGACAAAYSLRKFHRSTFRDLLWCLATAGVLGIGLNALAAFANGITPVTHLARCAVAFSSLLRFVPVTFALEEVSFRGAFDAHAYLPGDRRPLLTAFVVSALWGLWHIPVYPLRLSWLRLLMLVGFHSAIGIPLSFAWRRSGNLFVTAFTHALIDAVRDGLSV